jgi:Flp pilus assembly protein TadG
MPIRRNTTRWRGQRGAVLVEFAFVVVLLFVLLYALIAYGLMLALKQSVTNAASEGARAAIGADLQASYDASRDSLDWLGSKCCRSDGSYAPQVAGAPLVINPERAFCSSSATNPGDPECVTVSVTYDYAGSPLLPPLPGWSVVFPDTIRTTGVIQLP